MIKLGGQQLDGERGRLHGRLMVVGRGQGLCRTRGGIPTPVIPTPARRVENTWWSPGSSECCRC